MAAARELQALLASADTAAALEGHYARAIERILRELAHGVSRPGAGRARDVLIRIRELAAGLDPRRDSYVRDWIRTRIRDAFILGDHAATRQLREELERATTSERASFGELNRAMTAVNAVSLRGLAAALSDRLSDVHRQVLITAGLTIRRTQLVFQQDQAVRESIVSGIIRGAAGRRVSDDIARIILEGKAGPEALRRLRGNGFHNDTIDLYKRLSEGQFIQVGGRNFSVRVYANLTARTMMREAHRVATVVRLQQNGVDHIRISRHVQKDADVCTPYAGRVFYVGSKPEDPLGFPTLKSIPNGGPPFHPNCAHVAEPFVAVLKSPATIDRARRDAELLPARFFGKSAAEVTELVHAMDPAALEEIAPKGFDDLKGRAA